MLQQLVGLRLPAREGHGVVCGELLEVPTRPTDTSVAPGRGGRILFAGAEGKCWTAKMGAGASVAHELSLPSIHNNLHHVGKSTGGVKPRGGQYGEMLVHLRLVSVTSCSVCTAIHCDAEWTYGIIRTQIADFASCTGTAVDF